MERTGAKRGVLIAGGFHTPGLTRYLRESGVPYAVIQPRFDTAEGTPSRTTSLSPRNWRLCPRPASAREMNNLGFGTGALPLASNVSTQMGVIDYGSALVESLSTGGKTQKSFWRLKEGSLKNHPAKKSRSIPPIKSTPKIFRS